MEKIKTVGKRASAEFTEKKSVFIGHAAPVGSEDEAKAFISEIKKKYSDARHNVSAYVLSNGIMHSSDDGEPSGTGGVPILEVIKKSGIVNVAIVVTRYFGGILLGTGGLLRAYSQAAKMAVDEAGIVTYEVFTECSIVCDYGDYNDIVYRLEQHTVKMTGTEYGDKVRIGFQILGSETEALCSEINTRFDAKYSVERIGEILGTK